MLKKFQKGNETCLQKYTAWNLGRVQQLTGQIGRAIQTA